MRIVGNPPSGGKKPTTPTIGTATDGGTGTTVSVAFTPSTYIGKGTITYTALSSPGSLTGTGSGSPITVSGLTTGTAYTFTVKGDTNYGVASDYSAASNSVTPASPSSFESIATVNASGVSTITFSSIPSTYKSLQIRYSLLTTSGSSISMRANGVTSAVYSTHTLEGGAGTSSSGGVGGDSLIYITGLSSGNAVGTYPSVGIIDIIDYASTSKYKTFRIFSGADNNTSSSPAYVAITSGAYNQTTAISSITIFGSTYSSGSTFALYGIK